MTDEFAARRRLRAAFLETLYRATDGDVAAFVSAAEQAPPLGIPPDELRRVLAYLEERGWIAVDDHRAAIVRITADGVDRVEAPPAG
jgi:hypothetical protein